MGLAPHCASWWGPRGLRSPHKVNFAGTLEEKAGNRIALEKKKTTGMHFSGLSQGAVTVTSIEHLTNN